MGNAEGIDLPYMGPGQTLQPDPLTQLMIDVEVIKAMLQGLTNNNASRLNSIEDRVNSHAERLLEKARVDATQTERLDNQEADIKELKNNNDARMGRALGIIGAVVAIASLILAVYNRTSIGG